MRNKLSKNIHLIISTAIVIPVALVYGIFPKTILPHLLDFTPQTTDLSNMLRAIMGLYLASATLWVMGIVKPGYWKVATRSNIVFMGGLAFGRIISLPLDGFPSTVFIVGLAGELILAVFGILQLRKFNET